jgi:hypothetical protein
VRTRWPAEARNHQACDPDIIAADRVPTEPSKGTPA